MIKYMVCGLAGFVVSWVFNYITSSSRQLFEYDTEELLLELYARHREMVWLGLAVFLLIHVPYYFMVFRWFFRLPKKYWKIMRDDCITVVRTVDPIYSPERFVEGSDYIDGTRPAFQVSIHRLNDSRIWEFQGEGWRYGSFLFTAAHVVADTSKQYRVMANERFVDVFGDRFNHFDLDLASVQLSEVDWTSLAVKSARVSRTGIGSFQVASCYSRGKVSSGMCSAYQSMPHIIFNGSTRPGCSGAPLYVGGTVYGMHLGAGKVNLGLDANWIAAVNFRKEASEDFILDHIVDKFERTGKKTSYKAFSGDDIYVFTNGKYYTFDVEELSQAVRDALEYESAYADKYEDECIGTTYDRADSASLNVNRASARAEARKLKADEVVANPNTRAHFALSDSTEKIQHATDGLASMLAQLKKASESIITSPPASSQPSPGGRRKRSKKQKPLQSPDLVA